MPPRDTTPGTYVEELPNHARAIQAAPTAITAFIGPAARGPVNTAMPFSSYGDYERVFGGLSALSPLSYAVRDFFRNGGRQAIVVRLFTPANTPPEAPSLPDEAAIAAACARVRLPAADGELVLRAAYPGVWGDRLRVSVDHDIPPTAADDAGLPASALFNLTITDQPSQASERFLYLTIDPASARRVDVMLEAGSNLVWVAGELPGTVPSPTPQPIGVTPGADGGSNGVPPPSAAYLGSPTAQTGLYALDQIDDFNLLCVPPPSWGTDTAPEVYQAALALCAERRAVLLVDPPAAWISTADAIQGLPDLGLSGPTAHHAALYFPRIRQPDPQRGNQIETFVPSGLVAGVIARTDVQRGVWKAPAGLDAILHGIHSLDIPLTDEDMQQINPVGINGLRTLPLAGNVIWGARTLAEDTTAHEFKYLPVQRLALFLEESLERGTRWVIFEPNGETLWATVRRLAEDFLYTLFRQGAFQGTRPEDAYFVRCNAVTHTQADLDQGQLNCLVGFAPLKPAEFVVIQIQQQTAQP